MPESTGVKPPAPPESEIPDVEAPKPSIVKSPHHVRRISGPRKAAIVGLGAISALTGANMLNNNTYSPSTESTPPDNTVLLMLDPRPQPTPETERAAYEREIEERYGIQLLNQREANKRIGRELYEENEELTGNTLVLRWSEKQLRNIDYLLSFIPKEMIKAKNGIPLGVSIWDFGTKNEAYGWAHLNNTEGMISLYENAFDSDNLEDQMSLLSHELLHINDDGELEAAVKNVLGDKSFFNNPIFQTKESFIAQNKDNFDAMNTLGSFKEGQSPGEGRAGFAQLYVRGYERFMKALGPGLDGGEFDPNIPREELSVKYPRAHQIYDLYHNVIFKGKQYDEIARQLNPNFSYRDSNVFEATPAPIQPDNTTSENLSEIDKGLSDVEIGILEQIVKSENFIELSPLSREDAFKMQTIAPWGGQWLDSMSDILGWTQDGNYSSNWRMLHNVVYDTRNIQILNGQNTPLLSWGINQVSIVKQFPKDQPEGNFGIPPDSRVFVRTLGYAPARYSLVSGGDKGWNFLEVGIDAEAISRAKQGDVASVDGTKLPKTKVVVMGGHQPVDPLEAFPEIIVIPNSSASSVENSQPEEAREISDKFNVRVADLTIDRLSKAQYGELKKLLDIFPENFYSTPRSVQGWYINLVMLDGRYGIDSSSPDIYLANGQLTSDPADQEPGLSAVRQIARVLVKRFDEERDYESQRKIIDFLGGKKFIKNPADFYPYFKNKGGSSEPAYVRYQLTEDDTTKPLDKGKLVEYLTGYYIEGWDQFYRAFAPFFDPKIDYFEDWGDKNTKTHELYQLIGAEYFGGTEYEIGTNGIQVVKDDLEFSPSSSSQVPK